jgi:hypothetical protein
MPSTKRNRIVPLGELVAAIFDQAKGLLPGVAGDVATLVVEDVLLRTANTRVLRALQAHGAAI